MCPFGLVIRVRRLFSYRVKSMQHSLSKRKPYASRRGCGKIMATEDGTSAEPRQAGLERNGATDQPDIILQLMRPATRFTG